MGTVPVLTMWHCPRCNRINQGFQTFCYNCKSGKYSELHKFPVLTWQCPNSLCRRENYNTQRPSCIYCDTGKNSQLFSDQVIQRTERNSDIRVILLGIRGSGKSSLGNAMLGKTEFEMTNLQQCQIKQGNITYFEGRMLSVVETPGMEVDDFEIRKQIRNVSLGLSNPGPHIFILMIQYGRFRNLRSITACIDIFGEQIFNNLIIVFSHKDKMENSEMTEEQFIRDIHSACLKGRLPECSLTRFLKDYPENYFSCDLSLSETSDQNRIQMASFFSKIHKIIHDFSYCELEQDVELID
ncbi:hypothetical protein ScPMuIL_009519 [Solemya velum]